MELIDKLKELRELTLKKWALEREILHYTSESAFVAGLKEFLAAVESNSPIIIYNHDGTIKFKTF